LNDLIPRIRDEQIPAADVSGFTVNKSAAVPDANAAAWDVPDNFP